jgi:hypothetical protein
VIATLARPALARLRQPRPLLGTAAWSVLGVAFALAARSRGISHGADRVLVEAFGGLVLPLAAYTLVGAVVGARSLAGSGAALVSFGAPPARVASTTVGVAVAACALAGAVLAVVVAMTAHGSSDPPLAGDALASAYAGALGGSAYGGWFCLGASFGKRGGGRTLALVVDWVLGFGQGAVAVVTPRAHLRNLLGGTPPMGWPERASAAALLVLLVVCAAGAVSRSRRG